MEYIYLVSLSWFFYSFEPLQWFFDKLGSIGIIYTKGFVRELLNTIHGALSCPQCVGFWLTLILTQDFKTSIIVSLLSYTLNLCLQKLK